jgi:hypothetical protein
MATQRESTIARMESGRTLPFMCTLSRYANATGSRSHYTRENIIG